MASKLLILIIFLFVSFGKIFSLCPVYLTVSLNAKSLNGANLVINWGPCEESIPTWVGVYDTNPFYSEKKPLHYEKINGRPNGRIESGVKFEKFMLPGKWNLKNGGSKSAINATTTNCFDYFIVAYNETNHVQTFDCLKIQPEWMSTLPNIQDIPLKKLYIPGTHCSGCYTTKYTNKNQLLKKIGIKQNFDIWTQLVLGVRFLQFSVGANYDRNCNETCDEMKDRFWVMSENYKVAKIVPMLQNIKKFVEMSKEIVLVDFRKFPLGFFSHSERHSDFIKLLNDELGDIAYVRNDSFNSYDLTIKDMKQQKKYLLITYNFQAAAEAEYSNILWPSWKLHSTEYLKINELAGFMKSIFVERIRKDMRDRVEEGTVETGGWIFEGIQGVDGSFEQYRSVISARERAERINTLIVPWLGGPWSASANVVLLDFFLSTHLIDVAIFTNSLKHSENEKNLHFIVSL